MQNDLQNLEPIYNVWRSLWQRIVGIWNDADSKWNRIMRIVLRVLVIGWLVFCILLLSLRYFILPNISQYKSEIEEIVSHAAGRNISISRIDASWSGLHPLLNLEDVVVHDLSGQVALTLPQVSATIAWRSIPAFNLRLSLLEINQPDLHIRRDQEGNFYIAGILVDTSSKEENKGFDWILRQDEIVIRNGKVRWFDEQRDSKELLLDPIHFVMRNEGRHHRFGLLATPPEAFSGAVDIRADFVHPFFASRISDVTTWKGDLYAELSKANVVSWKEHIDFPIDISKGIGSLRTWFSFDRTRITNSTADISLNDVILRLAKELPQLNLKHLTGRISGREIFDKNSVEDELKFADRTHSVSLVNVSLETKEGLVVPETTVSGTYTPGRNDMPGQTEISAGKLDFSALVNLAQYLPLSEVQRQVLADFSPSGKLSDFVLKWQGNYPDIVSYQINGNFSDISIKGQAPNPEKAKLWQLPVKLRTFGIPGFQNLTGNIAANERQGQIFIDSKEFLLRLPGYYQNPNRLFNVLKMQANWSYLPEKQLSFSVETMNFEREGLVGSLSGQYQLPLTKEENSLGTLDAVANIQYLDMQKIGNYLPVQAPKNLSDWLGGALKQGKVSDAEIRIKGKLADFPFSTDKPDAKPKGIFSVKAKIKDAVLDYAPGQFAKGGKLPLWPEIAAIQGQLKMDGTQLVIHADSAKTSNVNLSQVDAVVSNLFSGDAILNVNGKADGLLQNFIQFVNATPVISWVGNLTDNTKTSGNASLSLKMQMPLNNLAGAKVQGELQFLNNEVLLFNDLPALSRVHGKLNFYEKGFQLNNIQAQFLGGPATLVGGTQQNGRFKVVANGSFYPDGLRRAYPVPAVQNLAGRMSGSTKFSATVTESAGSADIVIESDLRGLGLNFPSPLAKKANETMALRFHHAPLPTDGKTEQDEIRLSLGEFISAHYQRQRTNKGEWNVTRGGIGINKPPTMRDGLMLNVSLRSFDLGLWQSLIDSFSNLQSADKKKSNSNVAAGLSFEQYIVPKYFEANIDELAVMNTRFTKVRVSGTRQNDLIQSEVQSDQVNGQMTWIPGQAASTGGKLMARLASLSIPASSVEKVGDALGDNAASSIPSLDIVINNFTLFDKRLGHTEIVASNVPVSNGREWRIEKLLISNPDAKLQSSGKWTKLRNGRDATNMNYVIDIADAGKLLERFGFSGVMKSGKGNMKGNINWKGAPFSFDMPSLSGNIALDVRSGQFLKVGMSGANLLGVLSLQSLPRRLTLDFKDVFSGGFAFDTVNANAAIKNGVASTENFKMRGVSATVLMNGSVDIAQKSQNLHVIIIPDVNAGTASVLYGLAINPAIGIGTFLAQLFLREPLMKTLTFEYQITGSWDNPSVKKISGNTDEKPP